MSSSRELPEIESGIEPNKKRPRKQSKWFPLLIKMNAGDSVLLKPGQKAGMYYIAKSMGIKVHSETVRMPDGTIRKRIWRMN